MLERTAMKQQECCRARQQNRQISTSTVPWRCEKLEIEADDLHRWCSSFHTVGHVALTCLHTSSIDGVQDLADLLDR